MADTNNSGRLAPESILLASVLSQGARHYSSKYLASISELGLAARRWFWRRQEFINKVRRKYCKSSYGRMGVGTESRPSLSISSSPDGRHPTYVSNALHYFKANPRHNSIHKHFSTYCEIRRALCSRTHTPNPVPLRKRLRNAFLSLSGGQSLAPVPAVSVPMG